MKAVIGDGLRARVRAAGGAEAERELDALAERLTPHLYFLAGSNYLPADLVSTVTIDDGGPDHTLSTLLAAALHALADHGSASPGRDGSRRHEASHIASHLEWLDPAEMLVWYHPYAPEFGNAATENAAVGQRLEVALSGMPGAEPFQAYEWEWTLVADSA